MSFFDVYGRRAVFPPESVVVTGTEYGELGDNQIGTLTSFGWGSEDVRIQIDDEDGVGVPEASVWCTSDLDGETLATPYLFTEFTGEVDFKMNPGVYYVWAAKPGKTIANIPYQITVEDV